MPRRAPCSRRRLVLIPELPLGFIGWFFTIVCLLALGIGAFLILAVQRSDRAGLLVRTAWNDAMLFGIWIVGLAGGIGTIALKPWGRYMLELFCWTLIALALLSAASRIMALKRQQDGEMNWVGAISGLTLVLIPVLLICAATIVTLRSEAARVAFGG